MKFANRYGFEKQMSDDAALPFDQYGESLTVQSQAEEADLNVLMKRYGVTGKMPENVRIPTYGDFSHITDFRSAIEATRKAHEEFMLIPAEIRAKFDNDPQLLIDFAANPANVGQLKEIFGERVSVPAIDQGANQAPGGVPAASAGGGQQVPAPAGGGQGTG